MPYQYRLLVLCKFRRAINKQNMCAIISTRRSAICFIALSHFCDLLRTQIGGCGQPGELFSMSFSMGSASGRIRNNMKRMNGIKPTVPVYPRVGCLNVWRRLISIHLFAIEQMQSRNRMFLFAWTDAVQIANVLLTFGWIRVFMLLSIGLLCPTQLSVPVSCASAGWRFQNSLD